MTARARQSFSRRWPSIKLFLVRLLGSYSTAAEAAAHFGGAFALLSLVGSVSYDVALSTASLIAASAIFDQRFAKRVAILEAKMEVEVKEDQAQFDKREDGEAR